MTVPTKLRCHDYALLLFAALFLAGCAADSARPGSVCGHCDYRFSYQTPNPCDPCVPEIHLPGYGHTPTTWQVWPEHMVQSWDGLGPQGLPLEEVISPAAEPPPMPADPAMGMSRSHDLGYNEMPMTAQQHRNVAAASSRRDTFTR